MIGGKWINIILLFITIFGLNWKCCELLVFPQFSQLQLTAAVSVPAELVPDRKFFFDWGFQMNYDMPYNSSNFYNVPIWPKKSKRSINMDHHFAYKNVLDLDYAKYGVSNDLHPSDFTAGELYASMEDLLVDNGLHQTCLLKSVCVLAKHPFDDQKKNLITELLSFVLSPSQHEAFGENEKSAKHAYEMAEVIGFKGEDCDRYYPDCRKDLLSLVSSIMYDSN